MSLVATITRASSKGGDSARLENAKEMMDFVKSYTNMSTDIETGVECPSIGGVSG